MSNKSRYTGNVSVFFLLKTQFENVGDALINKALLAEISRRAETFVDVTLCPDHFVKNLNVRTESNPKLHLKTGHLPLFFAMVHKRLAGDKTYFVLPPGGSAGEKSRLSYLFNLAYNCYLALLKALGVELVSVGVSYDDMGPRFARIVRGRARLVGHHYVRDDLSAKTLNGLAAKFAGLVPDLAFTLPFDFNRLFQARSAPLRIAFSFRTDKEYVGREKVLRLVEQVMQSLPQISIVFVSQVQRDSEFMRLLYERFKNVKKNVSFEETAFSLKNATDVYRDCDYIFSNRLHALLLARRQA